MKSQSEMFGFFHTLFFNKAILKLELGNQVLDYISVKNSQGQELLQSNKTEISMGHLKSGVYFVSI